MAKGWRDKVDGSSRSQLPRNRTGSYGRAGALRALHPMRLIPSLVRQVKGSKGHLRQHKTCDMSNAGTGTDSRKGRLADGQCRNRGREAVVAGGLRPPRAAGNAVAGRRASADLSEGSENRVALGRHNASHDI
jgi:hypothetical protein